MRSRPTLLSMSLMSIPCPGFLFVWGLCHAFRKASSILDLLCRLRAVGIGGAGNLRNDCPHQAARGDQLSPLSVSGSQEFLAGRVDISYARQIKTDERLA